MLVSPGALSPFIRAYAYYALLFTSVQPVGVRSLQTSADTTTLAQDAHHSEPFTVKLHEDSFRSHRTDTPSLEVEVSKEELLGMYKTMNVMRRMEMAADALYKQKLIRGFCHLAIGQVRPSVGCFELFRF